MFGDKTSTDDLFTEKVQNVWDDPGHKNTVKRCDPPCVKEIPKSRNGSENFAMIPKVRNGCQNSGWFGFAK